MDLYEFEAILVYRASSRTDSKATQRNSVLREVATTSQFPATFLLLQVNHVGFSDFVKQQDLSIHLLLSSNRSTQGPCGRLNVTALINSVSGTIRRCGFVEVGVALLEEVHHHGGGF